MRFLVSQSPSDSQYTFQLQSDQGDVLLTGEPVASLDACTDIIQQIISALPMPGRLTVADNRVVVRNDAGRPLARSRSLDSPVDAQDLLTIVANEARDRTEYEVLIARTTEVASRRPAFLQFDPAELASLYRFERASRSGGAGIESFQNEEDAQYYFHLNDEAGRALLFSRGFNAASQRDKRLLAVLESAGMESRYELKEEAGSYYFIVKARNGTEIARSRAYGSTRERETAVAYLMEMAPAELARAEKPSRPMRSGPNDSYMLSRVSTSGQPGFETFRDAESKSHFFHFNDDAGQALLYSQGYRNGKSRDNGIVSIIKNSGERASYQIKQEDGRWFFVMLAGNRQQIARSRYFASEDEAERYIRFFISAMPGYASAYGVTLAPAAARVVTETERLTLAAPRPAPVAPPPPKAPDAAPRPRAAAEPVASSPEPAQRAGARLWLPWIVPLIAILLLLFFLRGCPWWAGDVPGGMAAEPETTTTLPPSAAATPTPTPEPAAPAPIAPPVVPDRTGPDAAALQLDAESLGGRLADLLGTQGRALPRMFVMDEVRFAFQSIDMNEAGRLQAAGLAKVLVAYPAARLTIHGHADRAETDREVLSENRARALYQYLVDTNVDASRLQFIGFGATDPISKGNDSDSRRQNRRLAIVVE